MKLTLGLLIGLCLGWSGQIAAEQLACYGQGCTPLTAPWTTQTPEAYNWQKQQQTTNTQLQQFLLNQNQRGPC